MSDPDSSSEAPVLPEVHPQMFLKGSEIVYGKGPTTLAGRKPVETIEAVKIASMSEEERNNVRSASIAFHWRDIPRDEFEHHKNTERSKVIAGRGFWSFSQEERTHRVHDKYREEIIKIWIAKFAALDAFKLETLQFDIREFSCQMWCCRGQTLLAEVGTLLPQLKNPLPKDLTVLADSDETEELLRSILSTHSPVALG